MKRLTERNKSGCAMAACCGKSCEYNYCCETGEFSECKGMDDIIDRLAEIEDILGEEYDLVELIELVKAKHDGRCKIIPDFVWKVGETKGVIKIPYKSWMGRFIGTKFYRTEKEASEAALTK